MDVGERAPVDVGELSLMVIGEQTPVIVGERASEDDGKRVPVVVGERAPVVVGELALLDCFGEEGWMLSIFLLLIARSGVERVLRRRMISSEDSVRTLLVRGILELLAATSAMLTNVIGLSDWRLKV